MKLSRSPFGWLAALAFTFNFLAGCGPSSSSTAPSAGAEAGKSQPAPAGKKKKIAYVTNGVDPFWNTAAAGVRAAEKEFGVECEVLMPPKGIVDQQRMVETLLARGVDGIAISPIDAKNQVSLINQATERTHVITHDSDAPDSKRLCFIGMDNYKAGRAAGKLVKEALPGGGKIIIFVGRLEQLNAQQRRQGVIDEVLGRPLQPTDKLIFDPAAKPLSAGKYAIVDTRTDNFDYARAKSNAEDAMSAHPDLACMVGLFAYNPPKCLDAVKGAGKAGKIKIVGFDEQDPTLQGIIDGDIFGTISQQPYYYGYHSIRILNQLALGNKSVLPASGFVEVESIQVKRDNVQKFWSELKVLQAPAK